MESEGVFSMNISLLVSNFGKADLFEKSLTTILPQLQQGDEICVADDSLQNDGMLDLLKSLNIPFKYKFLNNQGYRSGCYAKNVALKMASNPLIIINDPEVVHLTPCIEQIKERIADNPRTFIVPGSMYFEVSPGSERLDFIEHSQAPFIGGVLKDELFAIGGWDERFKFWGNDDNDLMWRLGLNGCKHVVFDDMKALHQWHPRPPQEAIQDANEPLLYEKAKSIVANVGKEWGRA